MHTYSCLCEYANTRHICQELDLTVTIVPNLENSISYPPLCDFRLSYSDAIAILEKQNEQFEFKAEVFIRSILHSPHIYSVFAPFFTSIFDDIFPYFSGAETFRKNTRNT